MNSLLRAGAAFAGLFALVSTVVAQTAPRTFTSLYVFGDSLSDSGNVFLASQGTTPPPPYFNGRFSNGPVFTELLGRTIVPAATLSSRGIDRNFAFGGATAAPGGTVPSFAVQLGGYTQVGQPARPTDLFTVLFGANDLIPVLTSPQAALNPSLIDAAGRTAAANTFIGTEILVRDMGARNVVVAGLPNLGATPRSLAVGGPGGAGAAFGLRATNAFNTELRSRLQTLATATPDLNLIYVDLQGVLDRVIADYQRLGFANATSYYLAPAAQGGRVGDPNSYVFFDDIHPTARTHSILAAIIVEQLNPEFPLGFAAAQGQAALALQATAQSAFDGRIAQLAAARATRPPGRAQVYANYTYADGDRAAEGWRSKFGFTTSVVTAGTEVAAGADTLLGAAIATGRLKATVRGGGGTFQVQDTTGRLYGLWRGGPVTLALDGAYGVLRLKDIHRTTAFGGLQTNGDTSGIHWGAGVKAIWGLDAGSFEARPWLGLRTERIEIEAYRERDLPAVAMDFGEQEATASTVGVGVDLGKAWSHAGRDMRADFRVAWRGGIGSDERTVSGRLADNFTRVTRIALEDGDGDTIEIGGSLTAALGKSWSAIIGYAGEIRSDEKFASRASLSLQSGF